jgi:predicted MFS family arabinose efflux permease
LHELACLPQVVSKEQLPAAMGRTQATIGITYLLGPPLGGILGSLSVGWIQRRFSFAQVIVSVLWLYVALWLPLAALPSPLVLGLLMALLFFIGPFYNVTNISRRLAMTPDALQSRVNSVARLIALGFSPLGLALTGFLLQRTAQKAPLFLRRG